MAESVVTFFLEKLSEVIKREANLLTGVDEQIKSLRDKLEWSRSFLKDADGKRKENDKTRIWVNQVRDVAYEAEDVIDEFILEVERQRRAIGVVGSLTKCLCNPINLRTLHDVGNQIEKIRRRFEGILVNKEEFGIESGESSASMNREGLMLSELSKSPVVEEADVVGIENDAKTLVRRLIDGDARLCVISIFGMGGLGKTTLATKVYNSNDVSNHFDCRAWIYLSQQYSFREVLMGIIKQVRLLVDADERMLEKLGNDRVGKELFKYLKDRRYLVVIDDIWDPNVWGSLEPFFPEGVKGSRVMLTTRNREVANRADTENIHELRFLRAEECWELFRKKAIPKYDRDVLPPELVKIGQQIVAICGGLPLAIVVLGGFLLRKPKIPSEWENVLKRINWQLEEGQNKISKIFSFSYKDLPYFLKSCFLYFGVFPETFELPARKLIQLWVAEGFIQQRGKGTMEEVAESYLEDLVALSLVQVVKRGSNGRIKTCGIHQFLREFSMVEAKEDDFLDVYQSAESTPPARVRRLTIHGDIDRYISLIYPTPHLRSLLWFSPKLSEENWRFLFRGFRFLRVLDLPGVAIVKLPAEIGEMIHLRYLGLKGHLMVPSTISNLVNLQTLDIRPLNPSDSRHPYSIDFVPQVLPSVIGTMNQLRHLHMKYGTISGRFSIDCLRNLQTLSDIEAGDWIGAGLASLINLRKLGVVRALKLHKQVLSDSIAKLDGLHSLSLEFQDYEMPALMVTNHDHLAKLRLFGCLEKLPELHEFPPRLTYLRLEGSYLMHDPMVTLEKLSYLKILRLRQRVFMGKEMVCAKQGFPRLEELELEYFPVLEKWTVEEGALSSLTHLNITYCSRLKMLPEGLQHVTTLQKLELNEIPEELKTRIHVENGEDRDKVRHVPCLIIDRKKRE